MSIQLTKIDKDDKTSVSACNLSYTTMENVEDLGCGEDTNHFVGALLKNIIIDNKGFVKHFNANIYKERKPCYEQKRNIKWKRPSLSVWLACLVP